MFLLALYDDTFSMNGSRPSLSCVFRLPVAVFCAALAVWVMPHVVSADAGMRETSPTLTPQTVLGQVNTERFRHGIGPLRLDADLSVAASRKAADMVARGYFAHNDPEGAPPWRWLDDVAYDYHYAGENLAIGFTSVAEEHVAWMASDFHRRNILNASYDETGIAVVEGMIRGEPEILVVQFFALRTPIPTAVRSPAPLPDVRGASLMTPRPAPMGESGLQPMEETARQLAILVFLAIETLVSAAIALPLLRRRQHHGALAFASAVL